MLAPLWPWIAHGFEPFCQRCYFGRSDRAGRSFEGVGGEFPVIARLGGVELRPDRCELAEKQADQLAFESTVSGCVLVQLGTIEDGGVGSFCLACLPPFGPPIG